MEHVDTLAVYCEYVGTVLDEQANHADIAVESSKVKCREAVIALTVLVQPLLKMLSPGFTLAFLHHTWVTSLTTATIVWLALDVFIAQNEVNQNLTGTLMVLVRRIHERSVSALVVDRNNIKF